MYATVLGLTGLLALAVLLLPLAKRLAFPYTVMLALAGVVIGGIVVLTKDIAGLGPLGDFLGALDGFTITSESVFFVFLPALVFESAMAIDVRRLLDDIAPILLLAIVGLLISTFAIGYAIWLVSPLGLIACLLLGAIVSATDPVAVVAIFKDLGAPKRLAILVEGESLFNDATAIVLFTILSAMLAGGAEADLLGGLVEFITVFFGGVVVGYIMARIVCAVLARLHNLPLVEISLTISLAYLSFVVAEHYLHVSGVMAVVTAALVIGSTGRTAIAPSSWHGLEETWEQIGFWANTFIFVLVGMAVPSLLADAGLQDLVLLVVLLAVAFVARAAVLFGLLPLFAKTGLAERISNSFKLVMFWGGLRGAVSLALVLAVMENEAFPEEVRSTLGVLVTGFVLFTLFVNATTMGPLMTLTGLDRLSQADIVVRDRAVAMSLVNVRGALAAAAEEQQCDNTVARNVDERYERRLGDAEGRLAEAAQLDDATWVQIGLSTLTSRERKLYFRYFADGYVSAPTVRILLGDVDDLADGLKSGGVEGYLSAVDKAFGFGIGFRIALVMQQRIGYERPLATRIAERFEQMLTAQTILRQLLGEGFERATALLSPAATDQLRATLDRRLEKIHQALAALDLQYPEYARHLHGSYLERVAIRREDADYNDMLGDAIIGKEVFDNLQKDLALRAAELKSRSHLDLGLEPESLIGKVSFFSDLGRDKIGEIARLLKPRLVLPGDTVVHKGEPGDCMYFISNGSLEVDLGERKVQLGSGDFFGEIALLTEQPRTADVTSLGYSQLLALYVRDFSHLLEANPDLRAHITKVAEARLGDAAAPS